MVKQTTLHTMILLLMVSLSAKAIHEIQMNDINGAWEGHMQIPDGPKLSIGFEIFKDANKQWTGNVSSIDQGNRYIKVSKISLNQQTVEVKLSGSPITIIGKISKQMNSIEGNFNQGAHQFPLTLNKVEQLKDIHRKQTPDKATSYLINEVAYPNKNDDTWLSGTLTLPNKTTANPAIMLIAGSGPNHRDSYHSGHRPFKVMADYFTRNGYAVLRSDKRGVYKSTGVFSEGNVDEFSTDTQAGIQWLKSQPYIDPNRIYLVGHSEGSMVAAITANAEPVAGIISLAGPGMSTLDILLLQDQTEPMAKGASPTEVKTLHKFSQQFYQIVLGENNAESRKQKLQSLYDGLSGEEAKINKKWNDRIGTLNVNTAHTDDFKTFLQQNPLNDWQTITSPVLIINGGKDAQVPAFQNVKGLSESMINNSRNLKIVLFPNLNHMFQNAQTGSTDEYATIEETIEEDVMRTMLNWLDSQHQ